MFKLGVLCFLALVAVVGLLYVLMVVKGGMDDDEN